MNEAEAIVVDQFDGETGLGGEIIKDVNEGRDALFEDEWGVEQGAGKDFFDGFKTVERLEYGYEWIYQSECL